MNPDNPTFRTPEEAARAKEYVRLTEENARLRAALEQALNAFSHIHEHNDTQVVEGAMTRIGKALEETK